MLSWGNLPIRLLDMFFAYRVAPLLREKALRISSPPSVPLSQMETITNAPSAQQEDITFNGLLWSVWFGSLGRVDSPKPHSCIWVHPTKSWEGQTQSEWCPWFLSLDLLSSWRRKDPQLPRRAPSWPYIWDIKELKQLQKESAINYVSQIASRGGPALFRPWMRCNVWLWQAYLSYTSMGGVENTSVVWKHPTLCRRGGHNQPGHLAVESHPPGHISSSFSHLQCGELGCLLKGMELKIFLCSLGLE